jgi:acyl-CoA synthetase (AMP-forming)/AMP-acid ligase II
MGSGVFVQQGTHERRDVPDQPAVENVADRDATVTALVRRADDHPAMIVPHGETLTFEQLHTSVAQLGRELRTAGVADGDTVALSLGNGPDMVACFLAILAMRASAAPLNPAYTASEARAYVDDLRPRALIIQPSVGLGAAEACAALEVPVHELAATGRGERAFTLGLEMAAEAVELPRGDDVALLLHTSGTTSRPKVVPLRQVNLASSMLAIIDSYQLGPEDVSHCVMPLFHVHGLLASTLAALASGGTVLVPPRFSASAFWADTTEHGATWFSAVPTIHQVLSLRAEQEPVPRHALCFGRSCSAALSVTLQARVEELFRVPLLQAYGMTEAAHQMSTNPLPPAERRPGSVGCATGVEIGLFDDDWHRVDGATGEVAIRGRSVVERYRDNPQANETSFRDGWFRTGDVGRVSSDGYLTLEGRIKELINRGGEKISPFEVEEALLAHPGVTEAVAYAVPDDKYGEIVAAAVVTRGPVDERELTKHCAGRLASFKVPVSVAVVDQIPKGPTGKVQRRLLSELIKR